jgi:hypothetical protein
MNLLSMGYVANLSRASYDGTYLYAATGDGMRVFRLPDLSGL